MSLLHKPRVPDLARGTPVAFEREGNRIRGTVIAILPGRDHDVDCAIVEIEHELPGNLYAVPINEIETAASSGVSHE